MGNDQKSARYERNTYLQIFRKIGKCPVKLNVWPILSNIQERKRERERNIEEIYILVQFRVATDVIRIESSKSRPCLFARNNDTESVQIILMDRFNLSQFPRKFRLRFLMCFCWRCARCVMQRNTNSILYLLGFAFLRTPRLSLLFTV